jgi:hypothetical protein
MLVSTVVALVSKRWCRNVCVEADVDADMDGWKPQVDGIEKDSEAGREEEISTCSRCFDLDSRRVTFGIGIVESAGDYSVVGILVRGSS